MEHIKLYYITKQLN